jgi:NADPH:quinone reductase-like Zn-dependent oxidoreductase
MTGALRRGFAAAAHSSVGRKRFLSIFAKINKQDLESLEELLRSGRVKPVIDRCYGLQEVPEAIRYVEQLHARGKVVIRP